MNMDSVIRAWQPIRDKADKLLEAIERAEVVGPCSACGQIARLNHWQACLNCDIGITELAKAERSL